jgi:hypothetical protein
MSARLSYSLPKHALGAGPAGHPAIEPVEDHGQEDGAPARAKSPLIADTTAKNPQPRQPVVNRLGSR